jgi:hypothetical protein
VRACGGFFFFRFYFLHLDGIFSPIGHILPYMIYEPFEIFVLRTREHKHRPINTMHVILSLRPCSFPPHVWENFTKLN